MKLLSEVVEALNKIREDELDQFASFLLNAERVWLVGNGGSASLASHFASDLDALGFDVKCLTDNVARLTAIVNDYSWEETYVKQLDHMVKGDVLVVISVHGGSIDWSNNLVGAVVFGKGRGAKTLCLLGCDGGRLKEVADFSVVVPSNKTPIVEGVHSVLAHLICEKVRTKLCKK